MYFSSGLAHTQKRIYALFFKIRNTRAGSNFARSCNARPTPPRHFRHFLVSRNESQRAILCAFATSLIVSNVTERKKEKISFYIQMYRLLHIYWFVIRHIDCQEKLDGIPGSIDNQQTWSSDVRVLCREKLPKQKKNRPALLKYLGLGRRSCCRTFHRGGRHVQLVLVHFSLSLSTNCWLIDGPFPLRSF